MSKSAVREGRRDRSSARAAHYRFFGLDIRIDRPLPGFTVISDPPRESGAVSVSLSAAAPELRGGVAWRLRHRAPNGGIGGRPEVIIEESRADGRFRILYGDGSTYVVNRAASRICAAWTAPSTLEDVCTYLVGPVFGLLLYMRGLTCLHASAVAHRGRALVFVGAAEAGKSTLVAAFARRGHRVLTDDILVLERDSEKIVARPGLPRVGLWPASVEQLWGDVDALPLQVPNWDKRYLDLTQKALFQDVALPVGAVYVLVERRREAAFAVEALRGTEAAVALIANKYVTRISEREQDRRDFVLLSEIVESVPIRRISRNDALTELNATCDAILADYASLERTPA